MNPIQRFFNRPFFTRLFSWEFWSFNQIYFCLYPIWLFLCLRARSFFFFSAANPSIRNGGFLSESKKDIYAIMPDRLYPPTLYFDPAEDKGSVSARLKERNFNFPLIGKPDIGRRGRAVKILNNEAELAAYIDRITVDYHIQQFIPYENEVGIFYYRYPGEPAGRISGIVKKEFLKVTGDGRNTIRRLLKADKRAVLYLKNFEKMHGTALDKVLPAGEEKILAPYGNHIRGSKFLDHSYLIEEKISRVVDEICRQVDQFYYGRLDIRYRDWEEFREGKNFSVIEVNGSGSEPTHIYDPKHSLFFGWKEIVRHWIILWRISKMNHKKGIPYLSLKEGIAMFREEAKHSKKLAQMPE